MRVSVIGLGVMGHGMAGQILEHGHQLSVFNRTASRAQDLVERGAVSAPTPAAAVNDANFLILMVSDDHALRTVAEGADGFLKALQSGSIVIQMSTVGPEITEWLAHEVAARGASMIDGPVMGSLAEAKTGMLWVLAGGDAATIEAAKPVLDCLAQQVYHVGAIGQGTRLKLCCNLVTGGVVAALAEAMSLIERSGLDAQLYLRLLKDTDLPSRVWLGKATLMANQDFSPRFSLDNLAKDISLALAIADQAALALPQGRATLRSLEQAATAVGGDKDIAALIEGIVRQGQNRQDSAGMSSE